MNNSSNTYFTVDKNITNFNEFQKDLISFITNYLDNYNKKRFFEINVNFLFY